MTDGLESTPVKLPPRDWREIISKKYRNQWELTGDLATYANNIKFIPDKDIFDNENDNDNEKNQPKTQGCVWTPIKGATPGRCL